MGRARCGWKPMLEGNVASRSPLVKYIFLLDRPETEHVYRLAQNTCFDQRVFVCSYYVWGYSLRQLVCFRCMLSRVLDAAVLGRDCRGGNTCSSQIRLGFTKQHSCCICLALREEYSDVLDELLEIHSEIVDRLGRKDVDKQRAGPSSHPFKKKMCNLRGRHAKADYASSNQATTVRTLLSNGE